MKAVIKIENRAQAVEGSAPPVLAVHLVCEGASDRTLLDLLALQYPAVVTVDHQTASIPILSARALDENGADDEYRTQEMLSSNLTVHTDSFCQLHCDPVAGWFKRPQLIVRAEDWKVTDLTVDGRNRTFSRGPTRSHAQTITEFGDLYPGSKIVIGVSCTRERSPAEPTEVSAVRVDLMGFAGPRG